MSAGSSIAADRLVRGRDGCARGDRERGALGREPSLRLSCGARVTADRAGREARGEPIEPEAVRDVLLEPHDRLAHPRELGRRGPVDLGFGRPVEEYVRPAAAQQPAQLAHRSHVAHRVAKAPRFEHLDPEARVAQLIRPRAGLEENRFEFVAALSGAVEDRLDHRLGAAEALRPRQRYENPHACPLRCAARDARTVDDPLPGTR